MKLQIRNNKGQAIVLSYLVITAFIVMTAALLTRAMTDNHITERNELTAEALYLAEGATENAIKNFSSALANFVIPTSTATYNVATTFATFGGVVVNTTITQMEAGDRATVDALGRNIYSRLYQAVSTATHPQNGSIIVTVRQIFNRKLIPTFQHMIFYNDDLEILPGPNMSLTGRIHSNSDIYIDSRSTLSVDTTYFRSAGGIYNQRKENVGDLMGGTVSIRVTGGGFANMNDLDSDVPTWGTDAITRWNGTVQSAVHGVTSLTAPSVGTTQPGGYYATNANVVITNNTIVKNGTTLTQGVDYPVGTIASSTSFYNNREGKYVKMTTIDVNKLAGLSGSCSGGPCANNMPSNGLLYATRNDVGATQEPGIKLINGTQIARNGGLTVVSNDPVYVKGDYNTVSEKPTSIIADSLNLLSNSWSDANSTTGLNNRNANTTTYNCAFVAGISTSVVNGNYNGGLENYPRLHEDWTGINLNIKGSFVELWNSAIGTGNWVYGDPQYAAPNRNWSYNTAFNNPNNLPPFTPMAVEAERIAWKQD